MTHTLGALIESGDFTGYEIEDATWQLDAQAIEQLVYGHDYADYMHEGEHCSTFYEAEKMTAVQIHTWLCTDQHVGLEILCLRGVPLVLSWQTGRKSERGLAFLSEASRDHFAEAWERHRPGKKPSFEVVSQQSLDLPVAGPGEKPFYVDHTSQVTALRLSTPGVKQWMETLEPAGGIAFCSDARVIRTALASAEAEVTQQISSRDRFDDIDEERRIEHAELLANHKAECEARIAELRAHLVEPLSRRLAQLEAGSRDTATLTAQEIA